MHVHGRTQHTGKKSCAICRSASFCSSLRSLSAPFGSSSAAQTAGAARSVRVACGCTRSVKALQHTSSATREHNLRLLAITIAGSRRGGHARELRLKTREPALASAFLTYLLTCTSKYLLTYLLTCVVGCLFAQRPQRASALGAERRAVGSSLTHERHRASDERHRASKPTPAAVREHVHPRCFQGVHESAGLRLAA